MNSHSLSRRAMLQASGMGALVLTTPLAGLASSASAAVAVPSYLERSAYADLVGASFSVRGGAVLTLVSVDDLAGAKHDRTLAGRDDAFVLSFQAASGAPLASAIYELSADGLGTAVLFISPVNQDAGHYEAVIDRTIPLPAAFNAAPSPADQAEIAAVLSTEPGTLEAATKAASVAGSVRLTLQRLRVSASAKRAPHGAVANLNFPGGGIKAASVRLVGHDGHTHATGGAVVTNGHARVRLHGSQAIPAGRYQLVVTATDRAGRPRTAARTVTIAK